MRVTRAQAHAQALADGTGSASSKTKREDKEYHATKRKRNADDDDSQSEDLDFEDDCEDEDDYGSKSRKRNTGKPPPAKRAKVAASGAKKAADSKQDAPTKKATGKRRKSLSLLLSMPLDVLYEIFGHMHPRDIVSLSRTSQIFRETLLSPSAVTVWIAARKRYGAPERPSYMSEPGWTALLFGKPECQSCSARNIHKVDFLLRLRICTSCKKSNLIVESRFSWSYPDEDRTILDLIPATNVGGWSHGYSSKSRFFWKHDIDNMILKCAEYKKDIHLRRPNAKRNFDEFKEQRREMVKAVWESAPSHLDWLDREMQERYSATQSMQQQRFEAIKERLLALGYDKTDIDSLVHHQDVNQTTPLSEKIWKRIEPILVKTLIHNRDWRIQRETADAKRQRTRIVTQLYRDYLATVDRSQWPYLPRPENICLYEPFAQHVDAPLGTQVRAETFSDAMQLLPRIMKEVVVAKRAKFLKDLNHQIDQEMSGSHVTDTEVAEETSDLSVPTREPRLDLATSVFTCTAQHHSKPGLVVGLQHILTHTCSSDSFSPSTTPGQHTWTYEQGVDEALITLSFNKRLSELVRKLVGIIGLDPQTATAADMDLRQERFWCSACPAEKSFGRWVRPGYTWRSAASHAVEHEKETIDGMPNSELSFEVTTLEEATAIMNLEGGHFSGRHSSWSCGHCLDMVVYRRSWMDIKQHVVIEHQQFADPREPEDYFMFDRYCSPVNKLLITVAPPMESASISTSSLPQNPFSFVELGSN